MRASIPTVCDTAGWCCSSVGTPVGWSPPRRRVAAPACYETPFPFGVETCHHAFLKAPGFKRTPRLPGKGWQDNSGPWWLNPSCSCAMAAVVEAPTWAAVQAASTLCVGACACCMRQLSHHGDGGGWPPSGVGHRQHCKQLGSRFYPCCWHGTRQPCSLQVCVFLAVCLPGCGPSVCGCTRVYELCAMYMQLATLKATLMTLW